MHAYESFHIYSKYSSRDRTRVLKEKQKRSIQDTRLTMVPNTFINTLFLCLLNVIFMLAGIFLNTVTIISLRRSSQLRKKLCDFTILLLSCFDLAVVTITHPVIILSTIFWFNEDCSERREQVKIYVCILPHAFSMVALLTLNIERFLCLTFPIFHRTSVTKKKLLTLQAFLTILLSGQIVLFLNNLKMLSHVFVMADLFVLLFLFIYFNYKMFIIAKSKFRNKGVIVVAPATAMSRDEGRKLRMLNFKTILTCSLAVACFFICSSPQIIFSALRLTSETPLYDRQVVLFNLWALTFVSMNSTFNCLIFFWKNSILRREGVKIVKHLLTARS